MGDIQEPGEHRSDTGGTEGCNGKMTYIPKDTKRHWTAEEESLLAESWGVCGIPALAKKLNRSQGAIKLRASRLHLGPLLMGGDYVTLNQLVTAFNRTGSYSYKMISWVENRGLPVHNQRVQQNTFRVVYLKEFWTCLLYTSDAADEL